MRPILFILLATFFFTSCAVTLSSKKTNLSIISNTSNSSFIIGEDTLENNGNKIKVSKHESYVINHKDGYFDEVIFLEKKISPITLLNIPVSIVGTYLYGHLTNEPYPLFSLENLALSMPGTLLFMYADYLWINDRGRSFKKGPHIFKELKKIPVRESTEKFLFVDNTNFNWDSGDVTFNRYKSYKTYKKNKIESSNDNDESIEGDSFELSYKLNALLAKHGLTDTVKKFMSTDYQNLFIDCSIEDAAINFIHDAFITADLTINWSLKDIYKKKLYSEEISIKSNPVGRYSKLGYYDDKISDYIVKSLDNALMKSLFAFIGNDTVIKIRKSSELKKVNSGSEEWEEISLLYDKKATNLNESVSSVVTIKVGNGHGSGCVVSNDGYIVTNFHVISGFNEVIVKIKDGEELKGSIVRTDPVSDLALIKVDKKFNTALDIINEYNIGEDIFAIGTPSNIELGQTLTKGIISGKRIYNDLQYIQTDVSINEGNSGGALINSKGQLIGVVNAKMKGFGIEGLGFGIPSKYLFEKLKLK